MKIKINQPCEKNWNEMLPENEGKFCQFCEKKVWDLDNLDSSEISKILNTNTRICGKLSKTKYNIAAGLLLSISLTSLSCSPNKTIQNSSTEQLSDKQRKIIGQISAVKDVIIQPLSIKLVTKDKLYDGKIDTENNFEFNIPESVIKEKNIILIEFNKIIYQNSYKDKSFHLLTKSDLLTSKNLIADDGLFEIGEVVIVSPAPPDFYYFDGKRVSKNKFEKLKRENPDFESITLYDDPFTNAIANAFVDNVYLLYSK